MSDDPITVTPQMADIINRFLTENAATSGTSPAGASPRGVSNYVPNSVDFSRFVGGHIYPENGNIVAEVRHSNPWRGNAPVASYVAAEKIRITPYTGKMIISRP